MMPAIPQVAVLVDTSRSYGRDIVRGIRRYAAEHGPWSLFLEPRDLRSRFPSWLENWSGHGILARTVDDELMEHLKGTGLPVIELRTTVLEHPFPFVGMDNEQVGGRVVEHFRDRGFRRFACCLDKAEKFYVQRVDRFQTALREQGFDCEVFVSEAARWDDHQKKLTDWLRSLSKPVGVFACHDQLGFWVLDAAQRAGISVPEELAVVGAENDKMLCETSWPPLSSVQLRGKAVGHTAAGLLDAWMSRGIRPPKETLLPPGDIVVRQSSDIVAVEDPRIAAALRFIRQNATLSIGVEDVMRAAKLSRTVLERRMKAMIGRAPGEEINRVRFSCVERLLAETDFTLDEIAGRTGFAHTQYMAEAFRKRSGMTPGEFRRRQSV